MLLCAAAAPNVLGAYHYIKWFMDMENEERKLGTFKACLLVVLSCLLTIILEVIFYLTTNQTGPNFLAGLAIQGLNALLFLYFAGACKKFASKSEEDDLLEDE